MALKRQGDGASVCSASVPLEDVVRLRRDPRGLMTRSEQAYEGGFVAAVGGFAGLQQADRRHALVDFPGRPLELSTHG